MFSSVTVAFGISNRPSSSTGREGGSLRSRNPPDAAPAAKASAESATVLFQRTIGDRRAGAGVGLWTTGIRGRSAGAWVCRSLGRSRGSGRSVRARSARTGSTSASSGLIGPRSASSLCDAPKGRNGASNGSRTTSDPRLTGTLLQASRGRFGSCSALPQPTRCPRPPRSARAHKKRAICDGLRASVTPARRIRPTDAVKDAPPKPPKSQSPAGGEGRVRAGLVLPLPRGVLRRRTARPEAEET
jgi:hypothetical protein